MASEFTIFQKYLKRLNEIYLHAYCEYIIFNNVEKLRAPDLLSKKELEDNLDLLNHYPNFFNAIIDSLKISFFINLAKLIDNSEESLSLNKLINFAQSNREKLSVEEFKKTNSDRAFMEDLAKSYKGIQLQDLLIIKSKLDKTEEIRKKVKIYRDQYLAHEDINKVKVDISREDADAIFDLITDILNTFSLKTDFSTTTFDLAKSDCERDVRALIENLKIGRKYKKKEIRERLLNSSTS